MKETIEKSVSETRERLGEKSVRVRGQRGKKECKIKTRERLDRVRESRGKKSLKEGLESERD